MHPLLLQRLGKRTPLPEDTDPRILQILDEKEDLSKQDLSNICSSIFKLAGRQASLAYHIASGLKAQPRTDYSSIVLDAILNGTLFEPFNHLDWLDLEQEEWESKSDGQRKRLMWEWEKEFKIDGKVFRSRPCGRDRWARFQGIIENNPEYADKVKRLAISRWMTTEDLGWIAKNLLSLKALDLSDIHDRANPTEQNANINTTSNGLIDWNQISEGLQNSHPILIQLDWLGVWDWRGATEAATVVNTILPACTNLETLSIRGQYDPEPIDPRLKDDHFDIRQGHLHGYVCDFILGITQNCPNTVETIELRLHIPFMEQLLESVGQLKPNVQRVGIDIGPCVQMYPIISGVPSNPDAFHASVSQYDTSKERILDNVLAAAERIRFNIYREAHNSVLGEDEKWILPRTQWSRPDVNIVQDKYFLPDQHDFYNVSKGTYMQDLQRFPPPKEERCLLQKSTGQNYTDFHDAVGARIHSGRSIWTPRFFIKLYEARDSGKRQDGSAITLFPLDTDHSAYPVHPLSILQHIQPHDLEAEVFPVYSWLERTFRWRPVFDWDFFVNNDHPQTLSKQADGATHEEQIRNHNDLIERIRGHFEAMSKAGIPIHLLIGRRQDGAHTSSCYWGIPYNVNADTDPRKWEKWVEAKFDARLESIAPLVDTLSIYYDLRNPLKYDDLNWIEALEPYKPPSSICPFSQASCPWEQGKQELCPFSGHQIPQSDQRRKYPFQKMANKHALKRSGTPTRNDGLARWNVGEPPVGENAREHAQDDDSDDDEANAPLHRLARRTIYLREAAGWQRFWGAYALAFTRLSTLNVRMPRSFDCIGSWRLALLLDQRLGWDMETYTDERQHLQTDAALKISCGQSPVFEHEAESKVYPAGRFVRRSWFLHEEKGGELVPRETRAPDRLFTKKDWEFTQPMENDELNKAYQRANQAFNREQEKTKSLVAKKWEDLDRNINESGQPAWTRTLIGCIDDIRQEWENIGQSQDLDEHTKGRYRDVLNTTMQRLETMSKEPFPIATSRNHQRQFLSSIWDEFPETGAVEDLLRDLGEVNLKKRMEHRSSGSEVEPEVWNLARYLLGIHRSEDNGVNIDNGDHNTATRTCSEASLPAPTTESTNRRKRSIEGDPGPGRSSPKKPRLAETTKPIKIVNRTLTVVEQQRVAARIDSPTSVENHPRDTVVLRDADNVPEQDQEPLVPRPSRETSKPAEPPVASTPSNSSAGKRKSSGRGIEPSAILGAQGQSSPAKKQKTSPIVPQPEPVLESRPDTEKPQEPGQLDQKIESQVSKAKPKKGRPKKVKDPNFVEPKDDGDDHSSEDLGVEPIRGKKGRSKNEDPKFVQPKDDGDSSSANIDVGPGRGKTTKGRGKGRGAARGKGKRRAEKRTEEEPQGEEPGISRTRGRTTARGRGGRTARGGKKAVAAGNGGGAQVEEEPPKRQLRTRTKNMNYKT
ncbi:hypothetical protein P154DRAFT_623964 [Amniculicola lignicola CBS 123094]|uniref:Uncharacterized protein n=1 Tax=Amniculicola lignicola CBS 123094 TaxID=1392246 RepID=A0A6A5W178_9PLEO|nr:hypothetical protein P154DRAFT_623964 [Amniculicola lignicola CBS 123094]